MLKNLTNKEAFDLGRAQSALDSLNAWLDSLDALSDAELLRIVLDKIVQLERKIRYYKLLITQKSN